MIYGYLRVSSDTQDVNSQKQGVDGFAKQKGWIIEKYISDEGISGGVNPDKRNLGPMLKKLQRGDIVICSEISRLGRDLYMVMDVLHFCMTKEVVIYTVKDRFVLGDDIQSKVLAFAFGLSAEIERQMIRQRTTEGLRMRRRLGILLGRPPGAKRGYDYAPLNKYKQLIIDRYREGASISALSQLCGVDRNTLRRHLIKWGVWELSSHSRHDKGAKTIEECQSNAEIARKNRRDRCRQNKYDEKISLYHTAIHQYILLDMTIPEISGKFEGISYEDIYNYIDCNEELNMCYRQHAQKKLLKKNRMLI